MCLTVHCQSEVKVHRTQDAVDKLHQPHAVLLVEADVNGTHIDKQIGSRNCMRERERERERE